MNPGLSEEWILLMGFSATQFTKMPGGRVSQSWSHRSSARLSHQGSSQGRVQGEGEAERLGFFPRAGPKKSFLLRPGMCTLESADTA